jgi:hypothetical protein
MWSSSGVKSCGRGNCCPSVLATFTYWGKETKKITNPFKDTKIKVAFRTKNTIQNVIKPHLQIDKYEKSGVYQIKCMDCPLKYINQMG